MKFVKIELVFIKTYVDVWNNTWPLSLSIRIIYCAISFIETKTLGLQSALGKCFEKDYPQGKLALRVLLSTDHMVKMTIVLKQQSLQTSVSKR